MNKDKLILLLIATLLSSWGTTIAQDKKSKSQFDEYANLFTLPKNYVIGYTPTPPHIDGNINDKAWSNATWTDYFVDIEGDLKPTPSYNTRVKMMWDENYIYFATQLEEPHVWAYLSKRDEIVFFDNDFEIFIDPYNTTHNYFEIEINALNNIFDLFMHKPYRMGGSALFSWNADGIKHAVNIQGSLNNPTDEDKSWTVEIAIPFSALSLGNNARIPKDGDIWRINFSRVEWHTSAFGYKYEKLKDKQGKQLPEENWVWSPQGVIDMHRPERWGYLQFSTLEINEAMPQFELPYREKQKQYLWLVHYKQREYMHKNKQYAKNLAQLGLGQLSTVDVDGKKNTINLSASDTMYEVTIMDNNKWGAKINHEGYSQTTH